MQKYKIKKNKEGFIFKDLKDAISYYFIATILYKGMKSESNLWFDLEKLLLHYAKKARFNGSLTLIANYHKKLYKNG